MNDKKICNVVYNDIVMKWLVSTTRYINKRKEEKIKEVIKKSFSNEVSSYDVKQVTIRNKKLFTIAEKAYVIAQYSFYESFVDLIYFLDRYETLEAAPSVTKQEPMKSYYRSSDGSLLDNTTYALLSEVTLLEHYENIIDLIIDDFNKNKISSSAASIMIMLTIFHDIGKVSEICEKNAVDFLHTTHMKRSKEIFERFIVDKKYNEHEDQQLNRVYKNLVCLNEKDHTCSEIIKMFIEYDKQSRSIELDRIIKGKNNASN